MNGLYECFQEIAFEAEMETAEDPELEAYAQELCNEDPATRGTAISELRKMVFDRGECQPLRIDDEYLLRFLRSRNFIVPRAHKLLVRYCNFREQNSHLYEGVDLWGLVRIRDVYVGSLYARPDVGRVSIIRVGRWDPSEYPVEELVRTGLALIEMAVRQPNSQVFGGTIIIDLDGMTLKHVAAVTPVVVYQISCVLGLATPVRMRACHILNYSWTLNTLFYLFKRLIPGQIWSAVHFHGNDLTSLHQHIDLENLPPVYGGTCRNNTSSDVWLNKIKKYRTESFVREFKRMGYVVKD